MILGLGWPDLLILVIIVIATFKGFSRGFVSELGGAVAAAAGLIAPWYYNGAFDGWLQATAHLGQGSAHVVGMFLTGIIAYGIVIAAAWVLNRFAKLPILNIGNSILGAAIGLLKGAVLVWFVLFVALYFPLSPDIRHDLHDARLVGYFQGPNHQIDTALESITPWFARPALVPFIHRHHS